MPALGIAMARAIADAMATVRAPIPAVHVPVPPPA